MASGRLKSIMMTPQEFHERLVAAKEARLFTTEEMAKMAHTTVPTMQRWLAGAPPRSARLDKIIRAVE